MKKDKKLNAVIAGAPGVIRLGQHIDVTMPLLWRNQHRLKACRSVEGSIKLQP